MMSTYSSRRPIRSSTVCASNLSTLSAPPFPFISPSDRSSLALAPTDWARDASSKIPMSCTIPTCLEGWNVPNSMTLARTDPNLAPRRLERNPTEASNGQLRDLLGHWLPYHQHGASRVFDQSGGDAAEKQFG